MIAYANYIDITNDVVIGITKIVNDKLSDGTAKKIVLDSCDIIHAGLLKGYNIFKAGYDQASAGDQPDFSSDIPFPPKYPAAPSGGDSVSWFQLGWKVMRDALTVAAQKSAKLVEILPPLEKAGNKLVEDLNKYFGPPKSESLPLTDDLPTKFPSLTL